MSSQMNIDATSLPELEPTVEPYSGSTLHLQDELKKLDLLIQRQVSQFQQNIAKAQSTTLTMQQPYISDEEVDWLLRGDSNESIDTSVLDVLISELNKKINERIAASMAQGISLPLVHIAQVFELSEFEYHALLICLAPELRRKYDRLYAYLQDDISRKRPSRDLILTLLCQNEEERWQLRNRLLPGDTLLDACLLDEINDLHSPSGSSDLARFLTLDTHVLNFLLGNSELDHRLEDSASLIQSNIPLSDVFLPESIKNSFVTQVTTTLKTRGTNEACSLLHLSGPDGVGKRTLAASTCALYKQPMLEVDLSILRGQASQSAHFLRLIFRDSLLLQAPLFIKHVDILESSDEQISDINNHLNNLLQRYGWLVFASSQKPLQSRGRFQKIQFSEYELPMPDSAMREASWRLFLTRSGMGGDLAPVAPLARQFTLTSGRIFDAIRMVANDVTVNASSGNQVLTEQQLSAACRRQSNQKLSSLALKTDPRYGWDDIVLPEKVIAHLRAISGQVKYQYQVLKKWGFGKKLPYGLGLSAMFSGTPGTGKTMAAQVIARDLGLDLYKIDLSNVVSKYIGETEKNLSQIFQEAETSNAILLFDECDALFGKRTDVSDAHDRYANIEVSYLLQRLEEYDGIVILTTNLRNNIDEAFLRRIRFIVEFPFPDERSRKEIWQCHLPDEAPLADDIDFDALAKNHVISGGNIKNIVLNAAFLAAEQQSPIGMSQLTESTRREFEKIGKLWGGQTLSKPSLRQASSFEGYR